MRSQRSWKNYFQFTRFLKSGFMVHEMSERADSPTGERTEENSRSGIQDGDITIAKLRTFSRSLENLTSETLYSKWKRARGEGINRSASRPRSISLITPPNISREEKQQPSKPTRKNSFHVLQENVFRPRCWTIASPMEVIREHNVMHVFDLNNNNDGRNNNTPALKTRRLGRQFRVTLEIPQKQHSPPPPASKMEKEHLLGEEMKPVSERRREQGDGKQVVEPTSEIFVEASQKLRRVSEGGRKDDDPPIVARLLSEEDAASTMADSFPRRPISNLFVETVRIAVPQQSASMPASPNFLLRQDCEKAWDTVDGADEHPGGLKNTVVKGPSEMTTNNERSKSLQNTFSLGCTYAVISQPSRAKENSVKQTTKMNSTVISKEQRAELEEEYKKLKKVSLEFDRAEFEEGLSKPYSLSEAGTKEISESQPLRRFSELNDPTARNISSNRPTAKAILENITNVAHKTEKQRIQNIEKAFEWIRKELAELRAQDKDIMRTFSMIQAGIRKIKLQRALSGDLDEPYEYDIVDHSVDLSASFSYVPLVKEFHNAFPRRASLI